MTNKLKLDTREVDRIMKVLDVNADAIIRRAAFQIEGEAKKKAPYETSALRNSIYVEAKGGAFSNGQSTSFTQVTGDVKEKRDTAQTERIPSPSKLAHAHVGPCVDYAIYVEYPGNVRKGGERPYLTPAAEEVAHRYNSGKEWEGLIK